MAESHNHHQLLLHHQQTQPRLPTNSRVRSTAGEIVEVQGGHIVRSTGRKDRHSKVCTAKGPRDRRVRLSAHTAIQFYDVQDRLGYDRPSKAVDWLIKNAKAAIDELAELPAWHPIASNLPPSSSQPDSHEAALGESSKKAMSVNSAQYDFGGGDSGNTSFLPPSLDSDAIADTIKSFFPMAAASNAAVSSSQQIGYQNYPPDLLSRTSSHNQDLRLSLQSFRDPQFHQPSQTNNPNYSHVAFDANSGYPWNVAESSSGGGDGGGGDGGVGGYVFSVPQPQAVQLHSALGQSQFFTQRGPLQSSNPPYVRAWVDPMAADHPMHPVLHHAQSIGFASGSGFSGFRIPARIQGEEEHDGISDKPSSASSGSHH